MNAEMIDIHVDIIMKQIGLGQGQIIQLPLDEDVDGDPHQDVEVDGQVEEGVLLHSEQVQFRRMDIIKFYKCQLYFNQTIIAYGKKSKKLTHLLLNKMA
jgi:hypothetical protein